MKKNEKPRLDTATPLFEVRDVTFSVNGRKLLDRVNLTLQEGELVALIGPNGAGKSTLLSVLSGETRPERGSVLFRGRNVHEWPLKELARERGVLLQENKLLFPFTVLEVVRMGRSPWQRTPKEVKDDDAVARALEKAHIETIAGRRVPSLSGGEAARVAFARVLAGETGVLLLDEPTAALDLGHQKTVLEAVRPTPLTIEQGADVRDEPGSRTESTRRGVHGVVVILHDLNLAALFADRIALMREGRVIACNTPGRVLTANLLSEVYEAPVEVLSHPMTGRPIVLPVCE